jgi:AcrR family transcriptional regulator
MHVECEVFVSGPIHEDGQRRLGLRERKKARTFAAIQTQALRLFREQGYDATTVEQIADAAEVSPSTFFRYFPTKESVVLLDLYDEMIGQLYLAQPKEMKPIPALRKALREGFTQIPAAEWQLQVERMALARSVPALRSAMLDEFMRTVDMFATLIARREGRPVDFACRCLAGAFIGVTITVFFDAVSDQGTDFLALIDDSLALLEAGLPV